MNLGSGEQWREAGGGCAGAGMKTHVAQGAMAHPLQWSPLRLASLYSLVLVHHALATGVEHSEGTEDSFLGVSAWDAKGAGEHPCPQPPRHPQEAPRVQREPSTSQKRWERVSQCKAPLGAQLDHNRRLEVRGCGFGVWKQRLKARFPALIWDLV